MEKGAWQPEKDLGDTDPHHRKYVDSRSRSVSATVQ